MISIKHVFMRLLTPYIYRVDLSHACWGTTKTEGYTYLGLSMLMATITQFTVGHVNVFTLSLLIIPNLFILKFCNSFWMTALASMSIVHSIGCNALLLTLISLNVSYGTREIAGTVWLGVALTAQLHFALIYLRTPKTTIATRK